MHLKKIAIDLDGVVFDSENLYRVYAEIYDIDKFGSDNLIDNSPRIFQKRYNWNDEECKTFYDKYSREILLNSNIMAGADIVLKKLLNCFEIIVITARNDDEVLIAKKRLNDLGLSNIKIFNNEHSKIKRLLDEKCDYIIDDDESICRQASIKGINSIYFKNAASKFVEDTNYFKVVNNWGEIYKYLKLNNDNA